MESDCWDFCPYGAKGFSFVIEVGECKIRPQGTSFTWSYPGVML